MSITIKAAVAKAIGEDFSLEDVELGDPQPEEVLVRIVGVGICHSDIAARDQHIPVSMPAVLGHEGAGVVEKVGDSIVDLEPGDHVVLSYMSCGKCRECNQGVSGYCTDLPVLYFVHSRSDGTTPLHSNKLGA